MAGRSFTRRQAGLNNRIQPGHINELQIALEEDDVRIDAVAAVTDEIAGRELVEGGDILEEDLAFAIVDEAGRRTWLEAGLDGGLTDHAVSKIGEHIAGTVAADMTADSLAFAVVDEEDRRTWIEADREGKPTARALTLIGEGLGSISADTGPIFPTDDWAHWGDSLTAGGASKWPTMMAALTGREHYNGGWGGQTSAQIAARQGGVPARVTLTGNTIPASGSVTLTSITRSPLSDGGSRLGTIAGVEGTLSLSGTTHTFTRSTAGDAVTVEAKTYFTPYHGDAYRERAVTIWVGRNGYETVAPASVVADIQAMIDYLTPDVRRVIVMEVPPSTADTTGSGSRAKLDALNAAIQAAFPAFWLDIATWLRTSAAATAAGVTFDATDTADIANGLTPTSLRMDGIHLNEAGNTAVAARVYAEAQSRGWL